MRKITGTFASMIFLPGLAYEAVVRARNGLYAASILPQKRLSAPVLSVGNIAMGGTGKTPLVIYLAEMLLRLGYSPAVLTRGYGRIEPGHVHILSPGDKVLSPAKILGDEPALIRRHAPEVFLGVSSNRFLAGELISKRLPCPVFILDDGFQHRRLLRDLDIVLVDGCRSLKAGCVFPRGILREPLPGLRRSNIVLINNSRDEAITGRVIDESVETMEQVVKLREFGCEFGQGYHFSVPVNAQKATDLLAEEHHWSDLSQKGTSTAGPFRPSFCTASPTSDGNKQRFYIAQRSRNPNRFGSESNGNWMKISSGALKGSGSAAQGGGAHDSVPRNPS